MTTTQKPSRRWLPLAAAAVIFGLALIGARGDQASAGSAAQASRTSTVEIVNFAFKPGTLKIDKGSRVLFSNTSTRAHTATRRGSFDTGRIKAGKAAPVRFTQKGTFAYHCKIHPTMRGKIVVD